MIKMSSEETSLTDKQIVQKTFGIYVLSIPYAGYDTFDSAVVIAESEEAARMIHPLSFRNPWYPNDSDPVGEHKWDGTKWIYEWNGNEENCMWASPEKVLVKRIGTANIDVPMIVCVSFNAG